MPHKNPDGTSDIASIFFRDTPPPGKSAPGGVQTDFTGFSDGIGRLSVLRGGTWDARRGPEAPGLLSGFSTPAPGSAGRPLTAAHRPGPHSDSLLDRNPCDDPWCFMQL
jgi:hypothetical protein